MNLGFGTCSHPPPLCHLRLSRLPLSGTLDPSPGGARRRSAHRHLPSSVRYCPWGDCALWIRWLLPVFDPPRSPSCLTRTTNLGSGAESRQHVVIIVPWTPAHYEVFDERRVPALFPLSFCIYSGTTRTKTFSTPSRFTAASSIRRCSCLID
ncbi:hypothetical protein CALVIDRAFT_186939 [Calocera viscosa TUFC12733]|uniref:Uncharacterized protein n=1 Tax=Calocera viscosa (strain TUFC12733) TaxID=1330018 RepID=A0A167KU79_CALVF|nr:hypothetical protein CALVIDRAFT_186939 [Calocera viscosa TUFC12733]